MGPINGNNIQNNYSEHLNQAKKDEKSVVIPCQLLKKVKAMKLPEMDKFGTYHGSPV